ncbi:MAG: hypothetical protein CJD30_09855, partial [Sulfuricurvum sp. PD_MW2]|uniref:MCP four helix bundle domain-containing protein n=1 Tax=Sulfuricurvum sp. PD_MW2 TaxID=2027917 RepID=UPI000C066971
MSWIKSIFNNMRIGRRLTIIFSFILYMGVVVGLLALYQMNKMNDISTEISSDWMPSATIAQELHNHILELRVAELNHIIAQTPSERSNAEKEIQKALDLIQKNRTHYETLISTVEEQTLYDNFSKEFERYTVIHNQMIPLSRDLKTKEAMDLMNGESLALFNQSSQECNKLVELNVKGGNDAAARGNDLYHTSFAWTLVLTVMMIFSAITTGIILIRSITFSLAQTQTGLLSFFRFLNRESTKAELIDL